MSSDLAEQTYTLLRAALASGNLSPGLRVTETELAGRFGVSRTPIRRAIARLEAEGLLNREGGALAVTRPDHSGVVELYVMREILEGAAARLAAQHASATELAAMEEVVAGEPAAFSDAPRLAAINQRLHGLMYLAAHNRYLLKSLEQLGATMALLPSLLTQGGRAEQAHAEHQALVTALARRDQAAAEEAARAHARAALRHRLAWLIGQGGLPVAAPGG